MIAHKIIRPSFRDVVPVLFFIAVNLLYALDSLFWSIAALVSLNVPLSITRMERAYPLPTSSLTSSIVESVVIVKKGNPIGDAEEV